MSGRQVIVDLIIWNIRKVGPTNKIKQWSVGTYRPLKCQNLIFRKISAKLCVDYKERLIFGTFQDSKYECQQVDQCEVNKLIQLIHRDDYHTKHSWSIYEYFISNNWWKNLFPCMLCTKLCSAPMSWSNFCVTTSPNK